jgi:hypothetical protein
MWKDRAVMVYLRRMVFGILLLVGLLVGGIVAACYAGRKLADDDYNCLNLSDQLQVQLNTHLEPVPEIVHSISPDGNYRIVSVARTLDSRRLYLQNTQVGERVLLNP